MDNDIYIRIKLANHRCILLPRDKKRLFKREEINLFYDIDLLYHTPGWGDVWIYTHDDIVEQILPLYSFLYHYSSLNREISLNVWFQCSTTSDNRSLIRMTYGRDTFANLLMNLDMFLIKTKALLLEDIKIPLNTDGSYKGLYCRLNEQDKIKRLVIKRSIDK